MITNMTTQDNNLRRQTRNIHQKGSYIYGTVENVILGLATVRLTTNGARFTNLPVVGGAVAKGQRVILDYSAGTPPVVRPVAEEQQPTVGLGLPEGPEVNYIPRRDHSCRLLLTSEVGISWDTWTTISWDEADYQTDIFWTSGTDITLPYNGVYVFLADISWGPSHDHWNEVHDGGLKVAWGYDYEPLRVDFYSTTAGTIGTYTDRPITSVPSVGKIMQSLATHYGEKDEIIQVKVYQMTRLQTMNLVPVAEDGQFLASRITVQWMGAKE